MFGKTWLEQLGNCFVFRFYLSRGTFDGVSIFTIVASKSEAESVKSGVEPGTETGKERRVVNMLILTEVIDGRPDGNGDSCRK